MLICDIFLIDINDGKILGNVIVKADTIEEALQIAGNQLQLLPHYGVYLFFDNPHLLTSLIHGNIWELSKFYVPTQRTA